VTARSTALITVLAVLAALTPVLASSEIEAIHYDIDARIEPSAHRLEAEVTVTFPATTSGPRRFLLHGALEARSLDATTPIRRLSDTPEPSRFGINEPGVGAPDVALHAYEVSGAARQIRIAVSGVLHHELAAEGEDYARSFSRTPGIVADHGVFLSGSSWWLPWFGDELVRFRLAVTLPAGWTAVTQGTRVEGSTTEATGRVVWEAPNPTDEIYLVAAPFTEYTRPLGRVQAQVFLRSVDPNLASKYLEATAQYLAMYEELFGPYPYGKFALVENFWETGYGMPSFTLLGSQIIRFPFILTSSYPHEILHNWWGNSVFVDYASGNWCEGLTAYLADHMFKEGQGQGVAYRRDSLKKYADYVKDGRDFPLTEFRSRHSSATEAIGYGKSLMLWHMLRREIGDEAFVRGLRRFYDENRWSKASFADVEAALSKTAGIDLAPLVAQWVERTGAPELVLDREATGISAVDPRRLTVAVRQVHDGAPYRLRVAIAVTIEGQAEAFVDHLELVGPRAKAVLELPGRPLHVAIDPYFDLFRRLDRDEIPPTLSELFGAERATIVLPDEDASMPAAAWKMIADAWTREGQVDVVTADSIDALPHDRAVWLLGSHNRWAKGLQSSLDRYGATSDQRSIGFGSGIEPAPRPDHSFAYVVRNPRNPAAAVGWIGADRADALPGLARKLPHYGKYSFLSFAGAEPTNDRKGQWPVTDSPLVMAFTADARPAPLPAREPLARPGPVFSPARLLAHVRHLSSDQLEGRGTGSDGVAAAEIYIQEQFAASGLEPGGDDGGWFQTWIEPDGADGRPVTVRNVVGVLRGTKAEWAEQSALLSAHHDHLGRGWPDVRTGNEGMVHPGADDNASGVAVLLEVAHLLAGTLKPDRTLVFVAFGGEEWGLKGSQHYIEAMATWPTAEMLAMVNLDTVGRLGDRELQILGTGTATEWVHIARGIGFTTGIQSKSIVDDPLGSDQKSFHQTGVPAVQIFAGGHDDYHSPGDTLDEIDAAGLVKVATWTREAMAYLAGRERPLTSTLKPRASDTATANSHPAAAGGRPVSLGTLPDFGYPGPGVRVEQVMPGTPAERAGLEAGDLLLAIDDAAIETLRGYSDLLRKRSPGDTIAIRLRRAGRELTLQATLVAR